MLHRCIIWLHRCIISKVYHYLRCFGSVLYIWLFLLWFYLCEFLESVLAKISTSLYGYLWKHPQNRKIKPSWISPPNSPKSHEISVCEIYGVYSILHQMLQFLMINIEIIVTKMQNYDAWSESTPNQTKPYRIMTRKQINLMQRW